MNVGELIEALSAYPDDAHVRMLVEADMLPDAACEGSQIIEADVTSVILSGVTAKVRFPDETSVIVEKKRAIYIASMLPRLEAPGTAE